MLRLENCTDPARIRTWNLLLRRQTRYPLRHEANCLQFRCSHCGPMDKASASYVDVFQILYETLPRKPGIAGSSPVSGWHVLLVRAVTRIGGVAQW